MYMTSGNSRAVSSNIPPVVRILHLHTHCNDVKMSAMASQITSLTVVYSTVYSGLDQRKHQSSVSVAFVRGIHRWPVISPHKGPVTRKMFPFDDVIMTFAYRHWQSTFEFRYWSNGTHMQYMSGIMLAVRDQGPLLLTWFNFNPSMDK